MRFLDIYDDFTRGDRPLQLGDSSLICEYADICCHYCNFGSLFSRCINSGFNSVRASLYCFDYFHDPLYPHYKEEFLALSDVYFYRSARQINDYFHGGYLDYRKIMYYYKKVKEILSKYEDSRF